MLIALHEDERCRREPQRERGRDAERDPDEGAPPLLVCRAEVEEHVLLGHEPGKLRAGIPRVDVESGEPGLLPRVVGGEGAHVLDPLGGSNEITLVNSAPPSRCA